LKHPSLENLYRIFFDFSKETRAVLGAEYLPVRDVSVMLDHLLFGNFDLAHHFMNLFYFSVGCALLFWLVLKLTSFPWASLAILLTFILHPTHAENVAWISDRKDLLCFLFMMLGFLSFSWWSGLFFILAMWSKSNGIVFLPLLFLLTQTGHPQFDLQKNSRRSLLFGLIPITLVLGFIAIMTGGEVGMYKPYMGGSLSTHLLTIPYLFLKYLGDFFYPFHLKILTQIQPVTSVLDVRFWGGVMVLIGLGVVAKKCWRNYRWISVGILWFLISLLPVSQIFPIPNRYTPRYLFIPTVAIVWLLIPLKDHLEKIKPVWGAALLTIWGFWGFGLQQTLSHWNHCSTLWEYAETFPDYPVVVLTNELHCFRDWDQPRKAYAAGLKLIQIDPTNAAIQNDLGGLALYLGNLDRAEYHFKQANAQGTSSKVFEHNMKIVSKHRKLRKTK
jgi:hypothetical protein